jgi:hypothetical protein
MPLPFSRLTDTFLCCRGLTATAELRIANDRNGSCAHAGRRLLLRDSLLGRGYLRRHCAEPAYAF